MRRLARNGLTLLFVALTGSMLWSAFGLSRISGGIPRLVLTATLVLLVVQLVIDWRGEKAGGEQERADVRSRRERAAVAWIGGLLISVWLVGVVGGSALFCLAWLRWHAGERWIACFLFAVALAGVLAGMFTALLGVGLYPGVVWTLLAR